MRPNELLNSSKTVLAAVRAWRETGTPDLARMLEACEVLEDAIETSETAPAPILAIVMEGGIVTDVVSNHPELFAGIDVITIDYDTGDADESELLAVPQSDGTLYPAFVHDEAVDRAKIDLPATMRRLEERDQAVQS